MAAGFFRAQAGDILDVRSAGFRDGDRPADPSAVLVMSERGIDLTGHRSAAVSMADIVWADLVLTMERRHARELIVALRTARPRIHTLRSFADAVGNHPTGDAESLNTYLRDLDLRRPDADLMGEGTDDIPDPHGRNLKNFRRSADELESLAAIVADSLRRKTT